jgi:hypothetical protein
LLDWGSLMTKTGNWQTQSTPLETYMSKTLEQLRNKRLICNLALREFEKDPGHHNYDVATRYYKRERAKIQRAINLKKMEAGWEPPDIGIGMKALSLSGRALGAGGAADLPEEVRKAVKLVKEIISKNGNDPLVALNELLREINSQGEVLLDSQQGKK